MCLSDEACATQPDIRYNYYCVHLGWEGFQDISTNQQNLPKDDFHGLLLGRHINPTEWSVTVLTEDQCRSAIEVVDSKNVESLVNSTVCTYSDLLDQSGKVAQSDGDPLVCRRVMDNNARWFVYGVFTSRIGTVAVYTKVCRHLDWLKSNVSKILEMSSCFVSNNYCEQQTSLSVCTVRKGLRERPMGTIDYSFSKELVNVISFI